MSSKKILLIIMVLALSACSPQGSQPKTRAVYLLLDTSGTYTRELEKAISIMNYLLATLDSGDSIALTQGN